MSLQGNTNEQKIWNYLLPKFSNNPYSVAGMMGNMYAESGLSPTNLQNTYENAPAKTFGTSFTDATYYLAVDKGTYSAYNFANDKAGFGICQWTYSSRKENLLKYAKSKGKSVGDLETQLEFLIQELKSYKLMDKLIAATSVREASNLILIDFEAPSTKNEKTTQDKRTSYGRGYYDKYAKATSSSSSTTSGKSSAAAVIAVAVAEIGYREKASNSQLDDSTANAGSSNYTKYARDFDEKYSNWYNGKKNGYAWCDMFVDWCFLTAFGYTEALRLLCQPEKSAGAGCTYSLKYYNQKGQFYTSNPKPGDQIFFGTSLSNSSHTGLVEKVDAAKVYTIEGNTSDRVDRRQYNLTDTSILGYGRPAYGSTSTVSTSTTETTTQGGSKMSNSSLVSYTKISPNKTSPRNHVIDRVTIHCVVGQCSVETLGAIFAPTSKQASCNYGVGTDGRIALICEEKDRSWCTSSGANDHRAITIEVASDTTHPYAVNSKAYEATINLVADICRRNGKKRITWLADKEKSINYTPASDEMLMTVHRWFANKACPGDYLYNKHSEIASRVNALLGSTTSTPTTTTTTTTTTAKKVTASKAAQEKDASLAGTYTVNASSGLNLRNGAGTQFASLVVIPNGTKVSNYGYYTVSNKVKWLYIQFVLNNITYTGFASSNYLKK